MGAAEINSLWSGLVRDSSGPGTSQHGAELGRWPHLCPPHTVWLINYAVGEIASLLISSVKGAGDNQDLTEWFHMVT